MSEDEQRTDKERGDEEGARSPETCMEENILTSPPLARTDSTSATYCFRLASSVELGRRVSRRTRQHVE